MLHRFSGLVALLLLFAPVCALAQSTATTGTIVGTVSDDSGAVLPAVSVTLTHEASGIARTVTTDARGAFRAISLRVGSYTIELKLEGFGTVEETGVTVDLGTTQERHYTLRPKTVEEVVMVTAEAPLVETTKTESRALVDQRQIRNLPIKGRDYRDFVFLTPGATPAESSEGPSLSISGQRTADVLLNIDGADFVNPFFAEPAGGVRPPFTVSQESVQEFQVLRNGAPAEFGRTTAGVINVVTKSGSNAIHGTGFAFFRDESLTANDGFGDPPTNFSQRQFGGNLGGPIVKDQAHFFFAYDGQRRQQPVFADFGAGLQDFLPELQGEAPSKQDANVFLGKIDWQVSENNTFTYRVNYSDFLFTQRDSLDVRTFGLDQRGNEDSTTQSHVWSLTSVLSDKSLNEFRFHYQRENRPVLPSGPGPDVIVFFEGLRFGPNTFQNVPFNVNNRFQISDNYSYLFGEHDLKVGADINITGADERFNGFVNGFYAYGSVADFPDNPIFYTQFFGFNGFSIEDATTFKAHQKEYAFYVQDKWEPHQGLTLTYGVRWEGIDNPSPTRPTPRIPLSSQIPDDFNNWAPRVGIAWDPGNDGKHLIRANTGLYYNRVPSIFLFQVVNTTGFSGGTVFGGPPPGGYPNTLPSTLSGDPVEAGIFPDAYIMDPDDDVPQSFQAAVGYEMAFDDVTSLAFDFTYISTDNVPWVLNRNLSNSGLVDDAGRFIFDNAGPDEFPGFGRVFFLTDIGYDRYKGASVSFNRRFQDHFAFQANYTWSTTEDSDSYELPLFSVYPIQQYDPGFDFSRSARDIRHRLVASAIWELPHDFTLSGIATALSGRAVNEVTGEDLNGDGQSGNDRPVRDGRMIPRFGQRTPPFFTLDLRLSKGFDFHAAGRLEVILELFNALDGQNLFSSGTALANTSIVRGNTPAGPNSIINAAGEPLQAQIGFRYTF